MSNAGLAAVPRYPIDKPTRSDTVSSINPHRARKRGVRKRQSNGGNRFTAGTLHAMLVPRDYDRNGLRGNKKNCARSEKCRNDDVTLCDDRADGTTASTRRMTASRRSRIARYLAAGRHVDEGRNTVLPMRTVARDLDVSETTLRRWLKANHPDLWEKYWKRPAL